MALEDVLKGIRTLSDKSTDFIGYSTTQLALRKELATAENNLRTAYAKLGKASYEHFTEKANHSALIPSLIQEVNEAKKAVTAAKNRLSAAAELEQTQKAQSAASQKELDERHKKAMQAARETYERELNKNKK